MLGLGLDHLSLYQLTIEPQTVFGARHRRGLLKGLPDEDLGADLYEATQEACEAAGLPAYEVSNHARPGHESRHNLVYWRAGDWVGLGPGAIGRITAPDGRRTSATPRAPAGWLEATLQEAAGATVWQPADDHGPEYVMMGLRLTEGISTSRARRLGTQLPAAAVEDLTVAGLLREEGDRLVATALGRPVLNALLRALL
jgi:oxygen-independent coproporphyrinogen-3 oxidase